MTTVSEHQTPRPRRILCVDDEPMMRQVLALHLKFCAYDVETAVDGLAASQLVAAKPNWFDAVITDNQMPRLDGIGLVEKLRSIGYAGHILFFTSTLPRQSAERLSALRVDAVVEKGSPVAELMNALRRAFGEP